jgi:transposase
MNNYNVIGIDLAKTKFHIAAFDINRKVVMKRAISRKDFTDNLSKMFEPNQTFAFEACCGCHHIGQLLVEKGHNVIVLRTKDVKPYAKTRQKNDINDAIAICKAALDPESKKVHLKSKEEQGVSYLHKSRQNVIQQRIQRSNSIMTSLQEFGFIAKCSKSLFAKGCKQFVEEAYNDGSIGSDTYHEMVKDCQEIEQLFTREKELDKIIIAKNKTSKAATLLETIPGIGPINASVLSNKPMKSYDTCRDFAASLGLVPKQNTTGGNIILGSITKHGDRYARTMLIQAGRSIVMRSYKPNVPQNSLYQFVARLKRKGKKFNIICVAVANKLARIAYACVTGGLSYQQ